MLAGMLAGYKDLPGVLVLALPRGGVPVAFEIASALHAALDVFVVRKLGVPGQRELAMGAIASGGGRVLNSEVIDSMALPSEVVEAVTAAEQQELERRERAYRGDRASPDLQGLTLLLVDDGLATGSTMRAAVAALRKMRPARIVVAVPTAARSVCAELESEADLVVCATTPDPFFAVGLSYEDFAPVSDAEVCDLLRRRGCAQA
jgi:predicted phosphoribosyltransferase